MTSDVAAQIATGEERASVQNAAPGRRVLFWDFDGTLATRPGMWRGCLSETLDEHQRGHGIDEDDLRPFLRDGFPWHRPEIAHPELCDPTAWWRRVNLLLASAYEGVGIPAARAAELARLARKRYLDITSWMLYDDVVPTLEQLRRAGWRHVILSNHVPELPELVAGLGLTPLVEHVLSSAATGYEKPNPLAFEIALTRCGNPSEVWMIGDNPVADVAGSEAVGIPGILVRSPQKAECRYAPTLSAVPAILTSGSLPGFSDSPSLAAGAALCLDDLSPGEP
jgi:putative hydrolase of the HAD superfamily